MDAVKTNIAKNEEVEKVKAISKVAQDELKDAFSMRANKEFNKVITSAIKEKVEGKPVATGPFGPFKKDVKSAIYNI